MEAKITVSEYFYSLQGEGRTMGKPSIFIRLAGCNLMCGGKGTEKDKKLHDGATWRCDTIEVWRKGKSMSIPELFEILDKELQISDLMNANGHVIITGGEPMLQADSIMKFIDYCRYDRKLKYGFFEIETNGTIIPCSLLDREISFWNVSPKLSNSGMSVTDAMRPKAIEFFNKNDRSIFKLVISNAMDMLDVKNFIEGFAIYPQKVWVMPAASNLLELLRRNKSVAEFAIKNKYNFSSRLQVEIWDQTTGV